MLSLSVRPPDRGAGAQLLWVNRRFATNRSSIAAKAAAGACGSIPHCPLNCLRSNALFRQITLQPLDTLVQPLVAAGKAPPQESLPLIAERNTRR